VEQQGAFHYYLDHESTDAAATRTGYDTRMRLRSLFALGGSIVLGITASLFGNAQSAPELKVGDEAPAFNLQGSDGKMHQLSDSKGKSAVVLAWFPKAFTGG
jgi:hypothetical protein